MTRSDPFEIFVSTAPGLEQPLRDEAFSCGFHNPRAVPGGVVLRGRWEHVWRANLRLRGASRVLARLGSFRVLYLSQLEQQAAGFPWSDTLRPDVSVRVDATCRKSRINHAGAVQQRIETALNARGIPTDPDADLRLLVRIERDICTLSLDTSGEALHKRGHKQAVGKAPLRETMAALFLAQCGYVGQEPVLDPMCGSGTFVIEAAEIALGLAPGRARSFAFERLSTFDAAAFAALRDALPAPRATDLAFYGSDRDAGAVDMARANGDRAGVGGITRFTCAPVTELQRPDGPPGLVMVNPPYGARIGNRKHLIGLHDQLGARLGAEFRGWRVGLVTSDEGLARATRLPFSAPGPHVAHGGLKIRLYQTGPL
ncbi:MAG: RNA methyltransferase [Rhodobacterales bacterium]|nr:MAG: RNA methyltransferase [Rhodobacterales bacterium]